MIIHTYRLGCDGYHERRSPPDCALMFEDKDGRLVTSGSVRNVEALATATGWTIVGVRAYCPACSRALKVSAPAELDLIDAALAAVRRHGP